MFLMKLLFPRFLFSIDDQTGGGSASTDQQTDDQKGNATETTDQTATPTDFLELEGVKVPKATFEKYAREQFKDAFEAHENREKWQKEYTKREQQLSEIRRKAELADRLMADPRFKQAPTDPLERTKSEYIQEMKREFPDVDEKFFAKQFEWNMKLAGIKAKEFVDPIYSQSGEAIERDFLKKHPDVEKGSPEYERISALYGAGIELEEAYEMVMWGNPEKRKALLQKETETAIKARDEEAKRKLQQTRTTPGNGQQPKSKNFSDRAYAIINKMYDGS